MSKALGRRWRENPENLLKIRHCSRLDRERRRGLSVDIPLHYEALVLDVFGRRCGACGAEENLELDHHRPLQEGHTLLHNAVPLCRTCNRRKKSIDPDLYYDAWKLAEIEVLLWETRVEFERRFGHGAAA